MRRLAFAALALGLAVGAAALTGEVAVRVLDPAPRLQIVRLDDPRLRHVEEQGTTLFWEPAAGDLVRGGPCRPGQPVVAVFGNSILMVTGPSFDDPRAADVLRDRLRADGVDACVLDTSWSGWRPDQELAMLRRLHATTPIDVAVFGVWKGDRRYARRGDVLLDSETVVHDADGVPAPPLPVPRALHHALFDASALWTYATLALAPPAPPPRPYDTANREALAWAEANGVAMVVLEGVALDRPFAVTRAERASTPENWAALSAEATARGVAWVWLADVFEGHTPESLRLDPCCHFGVQGHALAGEALAPPVLAALRARAVTP